MKKTYLVHTAAALAALLATGAHADGGVDVKVSGYGTVAAAVSTDHEVAFHRTGNTSKGTTNAVDFGQDSRFGLQAIAKFSEQISFTGQIVAQRRMTGDTQASFEKDKELDPQVEWLFVQYNMLPSLNFRLGRTAMPAFLLSDSLNVGFAAPWLRAPVHLYASQPLTVVDGGQLNWHDSLGNFNLNVQASYGQSQAPLALGGSAGEIDSDDTYALNFIVERGNWLGRMGVVRSNSPTELGTLKDTYTSAGLQYDDGNLLVMAEYARRSQNKFAAMDNKSLVSGQYAYLAAGYRFGPVMPTLIWSLGNQSANGRSASKGRSEGLALRYDAAPNIALKAQVDFYKANDELVFITPATEPRKVKLFTVGADFVF